MSRAKEGISIIGSTGMSCSVGVRYCKFPVTLEVATNSDVRGSKATAGILVVVILLQA